MDKTKRPNQFLQGYVCACVTLTQMIGEQTNVKETLEAGIGKLTADDLYKLGVEQSDIDVLKSVKYL
jgi:hypothetical protein